MRDVRLIESDLDELTTALLPGLRASKTLDGLAMLKLLDLGDELGDAMGNATSVPRSVVGKAWFVFTAMLTEAEHARDPEPILDAAWQWQEKLRRAFGPTL